MPSSKPARLPITCPDFDPLHGGKRCRHYLPNGACSRPDHFMCDEWLKVNPPKPRPLEQHQLFGPPQVVAAPVPSAPPPAARRAPAAPAAMPGAPGAETNPGAVRCLSEADVASFKALGVEVCLESDAIGEVWLVPAYTGAERQELSVEHALLLAAVGSVFPGAKVTSLRRPETISRPRSSPP